MGDGDRRRVAPLGRAVLAQDRELVAHRVRVAEHVAGVGVPGDEPQRAPLARAADEDRDALLQRPRIADGLLHGDRPALEARSARAPHERQQLERVLQAGEALGERREVPAVQPVLALEPGGAESAHGAPAGDDVERREDLGEVAEVAVRDAGDERAELHPLGHAGEVAERRVALEHVLPLAADLRDLQEVVHHPQAREAGAPRRRGRRPPAWMPSSRDGRASRSARPAARSSSVIGSSFWRVAAAGAVRNAGGTSATASAGWTPAKPSAVSVLGGARGLAQLRGDDLRRDRGGAGTVAGADLGLGRVEQHGVRGHAVALRELAPGRAALGIQAGRVDHGRQPAAQPLGDDQVEHLERVAARALVALAEPDHRAQPVRRDDLVGGEPARGPVRLPRRRGPDEHDEARIGEPEHARVLPHLRGSDPVYVRPRTACQRGANLKGV